MFSLKDKSALITGGTSGIGLFVARRYIEAGARVAIAGRRDSGEELANEVGASFVQADVSSEQGVKCMLADVHKRLGKLDILVLNAGDGTLGLSLQETATETFERVNQLNLYGTFFGLKHGPAVMNDKGAIICTSSASSYFRLPDFEPYASSKATVDSLVKTAALELGARGIRVNAICPGGVATEMAPYDEAQDKRLGRLTALGRAYMNKLEIVGMYHLLAAEEGGYITGQALHVDGGIGLGCPPALMELLVSEPA